MMDMHCLPIQSFFFFIVFRVIRVSEENYEILDTNLSQLLNYYFCEGDVNNCFSKFMFTIDFVQNVLYNFVHFLKEKITYRGYLLFEVYTKYVHYYVHIVMSVCIWPPAIWSFE